MSVELWKEIFDWAAVVLVGLTFIAGAGALITGKILSDRQSEQLKQFDKGLTDAKTELGRQQERAATAERGVADAVRSAKDADAKAEGFRLDIAKANERAAEANRIAEQERLARIKIEETLAGWRLEPKAQEQLAAALKQYPGTPYTLWVNPSEYRFMEIIDGILSRAGWVRHNPNSNVKRGNAFSVTFGDKAAIIYASGVTIEIAAARSKTLGPAAETFIRELRSAGIPAKGHAFTDEDDPNMHVALGKRE